MVAFLQEKVSIFDSSIDVSEGSPFYTQVIQKVADRVGTDPFTIDLQGFVTATIQQAFPDLALTNGHPLTDILVNAASLLIDPLVRETKRLALQQSLGRPDLLTREEAGALGANYFEALDDGNKSRGSVRIYFAQPRQLSVTPANYVFTDSRPPRRASAPTRCC